MKLKEIVDPIVAFLHDAHQAELYLEENSASQFARRTYIRSAFSAIEGCIWILKTTCLNTQSSKGVRTMNVAEYVLLREESYELKNNGEISTVVKFLKLADNLKFTFKVLNKMLEPKINLGVGTMDWENFLKAIAIRNRITHPKQAQELTITDDEIKICEGTVSWFNILIKSTLDSILETSKTAQEKAKS